VFDDLFCTNMILEYESVFIFLKEEKNRLESARMSIFFSKQSSSLLWLG
jgi:hypothetical protein